MSTLVTRCLDPSILKLDLNMILLVPVYDYVEVWKKRKEFLNKTYIIQDDNLSNTVCLLKYGELNPFESDVLIFCSYYDPCLKDVVNNTTNVKFKFGSSVPLSMLRIDNNNFSTSFLSCGIGNIKKLKKYLMDDRGMMNDKGTMDDKSLLNDESIIIKEILEKEKELCDPYFMTSSNKVSNYFRLNFDQEILGLIKQAKDEEALEMYSSLLRNIDKLKEKETKFEYLTSYLSLVMKVKKYNMSDYVEILNQMSKLTETLKSEVRTSMIFTIMSAVKKLAKV